MKKRAAIYARVSTVGQLDGFSIDAQVSLLKEVCRRNDWELDLSQHIYCDKGLTGKNMKRPALLKMNAAAQEGQFDIILIYKINRLARNTADLIQMADFYRKYSVELYSDCEKFDTSNAAGRLMLQIMASMAEYDRNQIVENCTLGLIKRATEGYYNGGKIIGYDQIPGDRRSLIINSSEAEIVRRIFKEYADGKGYRAIANGLNRDGMKTKLNNSFDISGIKYILSNVVYIGKCKYQQYIGWNEKRRRGYNPNPIIVEGRHNAIIEQALWDRVQTRRSKENRRPQLNGKSTNLLTGLIKCPECGHAHAASNTTNTLKSGEKKKIRYYSCSQFRNKGAAVCHANSIRADMAEAYVFSRIKEVVSNEAVLRKVVERANERLLERPEENSQDIEYKKRILEETQIKLNNLTVALSTSPDLINVLKTSIDDYENEIQVIQEELAQLEQQCDIETPQLSFEKVKALLQSIFNNIDNLDNHQLKSLYLSVIDAIHFRKTEPNENKRQIFIILKINKEVLEEVFSNIPPEEALLDASSFLLSEETIYLEI